MYLPALTTTKPLSPDGTGAPQPTLSAESERTGGGLWEVGEEQAQSCAGMQEVNGAEHGDG